MKRVFLSASVPDPRRNPIYFQTANVVYIREAVLALCAEVLPRGYIVFGGHPAISPFVRNVAARMDRAEAVRIYQSEYFLGQAPPDSLALPDLVWVPGVQDDLQTSLARMRERMLMDDPPVAGVFIGGMEGVEVEYDLFRRLIPDAPAWPLASTGAAASRVYEREDRPRFDTEIEEVLRSDLAYDHLFRGLLRPFLESRQGLRSR